MNPTTISEPETEILIIDDDSTIVMALNKVLCDMGRIRFATRGQQALAMIDERLPGLILLDVELPDISGIEVCTQLKANPETSDVPVLFITSHTDEGFEERVFDAGAADYISKPLNPSVVAARVKTHLNYRHAMWLLNNQARIDGLTGLANRRRFDEQLDSEFKRAHRKKLPITVVMIDIDEFKKYNDHFGHPAGDECIKAVALALLKGIRRPADIAARYGGEEFALILPETDTEGAATLATLLLKNVEALHISHAPSAERPQITVSVGVSTYLPEQNHTTALSEKALVNAADRALYTSKRNGRNSVSYAQMPAETGSPEPN